MFHPTQEQTQAINMAALGESMKMLAYAGTGKTSTLFLIAQKLKSQNKRGIYLAFNKAIAKEADKKMPDNVTARTFHSLAYKSTPYQITKRLNIKETPHDFISRHKITGIDNLKLELPSPTGSKQTSFALSAYRMRFLILESIRAYCRSESEQFSPELLNSVLNKFEPFIIREHKDAIIRKMYPIVTDLVLDYFSPEGEYPLNGLHDVYLKYWALTNPTIHADFIMFDEAQDADPIMRAILKKQKCQVIYVGDQYQQIYSWRGAVNAMQSIDTQYAYLTQSFRFGPQLAIEAQKLLNHLGSTVAIQGDASKQTVVDSQTHEKSAKFNAYICRTNAGIIEAALWHIEQGKKFAVQNMDFEEVVGIIEGLNKLETGCKSNHPLLKDFGSIQDLDDCLEATPGEMQLTPYRRLHKTYDGVQILEMINAIRSTAVTNETVVGITAHSAKGMEYDSICLSDDFVKMFFDKDKHGQLYPKHNVAEEEFRLLYVAMTRAKKCLYLKNVEVILNRLNEFKPNALPTVESNTTAEVTKVDSVQIKRPKVNHELLELDRLDF